VENTISGVLVATSAHDGVSVAASYQWMGKTLVRSISSVGNGGLLPTTVTARFSKADKALNSRAAYIGSPSQTNPIETADGRVAWLRVMD
jgi:N-acetylglucosamine-6-phosphate deacetylase